MSIDEDAREAVNHMNSSNEKQGRILVVDDEPAIRGLLHSILSDSYACTTVESAEAALLQLEKESFDLVITDINMGGMDGVELLIRVSASSPDTVVMVISGNHENDGPIEALRGGAFDYIEKPFDLDRVVAAVDRAIAHRARRVSQHNRQDAG